MEKLYKQPSEQIRVSIPFDESIQNLIDFGYIPVEINLKIFDSAGEDLTSEMSIGTSTVDLENLCVLCFVKGGEDGRDYFIKALVGWNLFGQPDQWIEADLLLKVRERGH
jgi:hypothetical protein